MRLPSTATTTARLSALLPLAVFAGLGFLSAGVGNGRSVGVSWDWFPAAGINADFSFDGLSVLFGWIVSGIGVFVVLFAADYLDGHRHYRRFLLFLHLFLLSMLGLVFSDNLIALFVFWELTTVFSYLLIGFEHEGEAARGSARQALLVTGAGGLALLVAFLVVGHIAGTYRISALVEAPGLIRQHPLYHLVLFAVLAGAFTKSAQFPFHFWLPNAMTAPTPVSALLHSATLVKAGIYLLARLHPILGGTPAWMGTLVLVGGVTALFGAVLAMGQRDLKRVLAYTTVMALGILTMFLGGQRTPALTAAVTFLLVHSLYKSALFLVVGIIDHETGSRDLAHLGGLGRAMPKTAFGAATAALSMAGFPLFLGFVGKEIMYKGALTETVFPVFATTAAVLANALMTAVAVVIAFRTFWGRREPSPGSPHEAPPGMWLGPVAMGSLGLVFGVVPEWVGRALVQPAVAAFHPTVEHIRLGLFHGINEPLLLSVLTLTLGTFFYFVRRPLYRGLYAVEGRLPVTGDKAYQALLAAVAGASEALTGIVQNGSLRRHLRVVVFSFVLVTAALWGMNAGGGLPLPVPGPLPLWHWLLAALVVAAVGTVVATRSRVLAVCALGVVGSGAAVIFLVNGAPDLALTQLLVETLTLIIVSVILLRLPPIGSPPGNPPRRRWLDALLAVGAGTLVAALTLAATGTDMDRQVTAFFEKNSYIAAHGRNIVNVILVDFRSMDTLGEIFVVATAGIAGFSLIAKRKG